MAKAAKSAHRWSFYRAGGVDQVRLDRGADIVHLDQLDQKLWVALSCPVQGLEIDARTLQLLDSDNDAHVRPPEIIAAVKWLRVVLKDPDALVKGEDGVALSNIRTDTPEGKEIASSAQHILQSLGKQSSTISVADTLRTADVFAKSRRNGDGSVPPDTVDDEAARSVAADIVACLGGAPDRSGKPGFDRARLETFYAACADYDAWSRRAETDPALLPFGADTAAAYAAFAAVRPKIDDYFGRCRLAAFDARALAAVNRQEEAYMAAAAKDLTITASEVAHFPLSLIEPNKPLALVKGINPAWANAVAAFKARCRVDQETLSETEWTALCARFDAHVAWLAEKSGTSVEKLGAPRVRAILASGAKQALEQAIADDLAVAGEVDAMAHVEKLARLHRDFHKLLNNYVSFTDFYARRGAIFQAGTLYLDGRACDMCFHVNDAAKHARMAPMSNSFLAYVDCSRPSGAKMTIACAFTAGDSDNLFEGRNGIFYDRKGRDWDATIAKIVANPISIRQAFWSPYKKVLRGVQEAIAKKAAAADEAATGKLAAGAVAAGEAPPPGATPPKPKFEVGTIAALGVAVTGITGVFTALLTSFLGLGAWIPLGIAAVFLAISGPSMFIAWLKLRTRNLGPILDANGWAVNTLTRVNIPLGRALTAVPQIPPGSERSLVDPYAPKKSPWPRVLFVVLVLGAAGYALFRTNLAHKWLPQYIPAHHSELDLAADKKDAAPGDTVVLTVQSAATELQVTDATDRNHPIALPPLKVEGGKATLAIPAEMKKGELVVFDAVSRTSVEISVAEKK